MMKSECTSLASDKLGTIADVRCCPGIGVLLKETMKECFEYKRYDSMHGMVILHPTAAHIAGLCCKDVSHVDP